MPAGGALIGLGAAALPYLLGSGKNNVQPTNPVGNYNPNAGALGNNWQGFRGQGDAAAGRGMPFNEQNVNDARGLGMVSRNAQQDALNRLANNAANARMAVNMSGQHQLQQALGQNMSQVASTRGGPGAQGLAARGAMMAGAQTTGDIASNTAVGGVMAENAANQGYFQGASGMRGLDQSQQNLDQGYALGRGNLYLQNRNANDAYQLGLYGLNQQGALAEAGNRVQGQGQYMGAMGQYNGQLVNNGQFNANAQQQNLGAMVGGGVGAMNGWGRATNWGNGYGPPSALPGGGQPSTPGNYNPNDPGY